MPKFQQSHPLFAFEGQSADGMTAGQNLGLSVLLLPGFPARWRLFVALFTVRWFPRSWPAAGRMADLQRKHTLV